MRPGYKERKQGRARGHSHLGPKASRYLQAAAPYRSTEATALWPRKSPTHLLSTDGTQSQHPGAAARNATLARGPPKGTLQAWGAPPWVIRGDWTWNLTQSG